MTGDLVEIVARAVLGRDLGPESTFGNALAREKARAALAAITDSGHHILTEAELAAIKTDAVRWAEAQVGMRYAVTRGSA